MCTNLILFTVLSLLFSIEAKSIPNAQSEKVELNESTLKLLFVVSKLKLIKILLVLSI